MAHPELGATAARLAGTAGASQVKARHRRGIVERTIAA